jgi:5-formyltetrahydrofolate cyclo-ligase
MHLTSEKRKLRETMLQKRRAVPHALSARAGASVARHFADHPILAFAPSFAGYIAMRGELDVLTVFDIMAKYNKRTALPRIAESVLQFHLWGKSDALRRHPELGSEEPLATAEPLLPAIVLVPLLAFDGAGNRLGYGGGFYDRTMHQLRALHDAPLFIGAAYAIQELPLVPTDENDQRLDGIITEHGVSMF